MLVPLILGALCKTFSPDAGKYFGSFTNGLITGTVPILAVWFFCMGRDDRLARDRRGAAQIGGRCWSRKYWWHGRPP